jgi:hypothetical protein
MFSCPNCPQTFTSIFLRDRHIQDFHRGGYPEQQQNVMDSKSGRVELKALEHQLAASREKMEKERPLANPIPAPLTQRPKEELNIPNGWVKTQTGYEYEKEIFCHHTTENSTTGVLHATLNSHYIKCLLHTYDKDLSELSRLHEKETVLSGRLQSLVPSDPAFPEVARELNKTTTEITYLTKSQRPDEIHHLVMEQTSIYEPNTNENTKWQTDMMQRVLTEADRLKNNFKTEHESDSK